MEIMELKRHFKGLLKRLALSNGFTSNLYKRRRARIDAPARMEYYNVGPRVAKKAIDALQGTGIDMWLYAGSLLGAIRDSDFMPWDNDLDFCIVVKNDSTWQTLEDSMLKAGFEKVREFACDGTVTEQTYAEGNFKFDIFAMIPTGADKARIYIYLKLDNVWYKDRHQRTAMYLDTFIPMGMKTIDIRGYSLPVPENAEELLERQYGAGWKTPDPSYVGGTMYTVLDDVDGRSTLFLR